MCFQSSDRAWELEGPDPEGWGFGRLCLFWKRPPCPPPSQDMTERLRGCAARPTWSVCLHPTPIPPWWRPAVLRGDCSGPAGPRLLGKASPLNSLEAQAY
ncbi:hypothetical protein DPEC_G00065360 [Dallia pectoralis]|uniref:Uncharacterized protein n=1 Tax=Dallia pectoralis TaxID=75939 RepID=A0ACC2H7Z1_DALPE|nr:hypothetical protein DPEC_G00065360 [Dallia pectoralis]